MTYLTRTALQRFIYLIFVIVFLGIAVRFFCLALKVSAGREFSSDENSTLQMAISQGEVWDVLIHGAQVQTSSAPLDYVACIMLYKIRDKVNYLGLPAHTYFRLNAIFASLISGLLVVFLFWKRMVIDAKDLRVLTVQGSLLALSLGFFYFWPFNFTYSLVMRPYSLWNALFFVALMFFIYYRRFNWPIQVTMILLAATATGAAFQLFAMACGYTVLCLWEGERLLDVLYKVMRIFIAPALVAVYYIAHPTVQNNLGEADRYWGEFWHFWLTKEKIPLLSLIGFLVTAQERKFRPHTVVFMTFFLLYLISPFINYMCLNSNYVFSSRQYIYYDLMYPVFIITSAFILPFYWEKFGTRAAKIFKG